VTKATASGRPWAVVAVVGYSLLLLVVLLNPSATLYSRLFLWLAERVASAGAPLAWQDPTRIEFGLNALVFAPVALLGSLAWPKLSWRDWTAAGFVGSFAVEAIQALALDGRSATYVDVVANTLGALAGGLFVAAVRRALA
jgi:glycopeptide antibiotics resistance protein